MGDCVQNGSMEGQLALLNIGEQAGFRSVSFSGVLVSEKCMIEPPKTINCWPSLCPASPLLLLQVEMLEEFVRIQLMLVNGCLGASTSQQMLVNDSG